MLERLGLWPLRALWILLPVSVGMAIIDSLSNRSDAVQNTAEVGLWLAWFVGLVATLAPSTVSLTIVRIIGPASVAITLLAVVAAADRWTALLVIALGYSTVLTMVVLLPTTGDPMMNGSAYGSERRMALRPPAAIMLGPVQLVWLVVVAGALTGPLLLASGRVPLGLAAAAIGATAVYFGAKSLHQLSRRWIVFVPAGFVIHDYLSLAESILIQRRQKPTLGPATTNLPEHLDLSGGALGLALTVGFDDPVPVAVRKRSQVESTTVNRFVFTPSLPGQLLQEARVRAITIA